MAVATELMTHALIGRSSSPPFLDPIAEDHGLAHREHPQQVVGLNRVGDRAGEFTRRMVGPDRCVGTESVGVDTPALCQVREVTS